MNKNYFSLVGLVFLFIGFYFLNFQTKPKETIIIDGVDELTFGDDGSGSREATYYLWNNTKNQQIIVKTRKEMLNILYNKGYTLNTTYCYYIGRYRYESWIFEK